MAWLCFYRRASPSSSRPFRSRARKWRACSGRVLRDRFSKSENSGDGRRGLFVRRISLRIGPVMIYRKTPGRLTWFVIAQRVGVIVFAFAFFSNSAFAVLRVGLATIDITPPVGWRMSGYFYERL